MVSLVGKAAIGLAAIGATGVGAWGWATAWRPPVDRYPLQDVDLPENPPATEWGSVRAAGAGFAYLVATSGHDRRDPAYGANWAARPWRMWRASDLRRIDGIEGPVNWNVVAP